MNRSALYLRTGLGMLAFEAGLIGVHALFFPHYFYSQFLFGRGWVQMLPPYNEHITRDLGALYLGFFALLGYATVRLTRDLVVGATMSFMVATLPHMVFHALHTEDAPLLVDKVLQVGLLAATMGLGLLLLWVASQHFAAHPTGDITGDLTGDLTGDPTGDPTGDRNLDRPREHASSR